MKNPQVTFTAILFALTCFGLLPTPKSFGVVPPPDGGYPGGNTAEGASALLSLTTGTFNTAVGFFSLRSNTEGGFNTAIGAGALLANTASENTATGAGALFSNTTGNFNTANGEFALFSNTTSGANTAMGYATLFRNTTGTQNTATGASALVSNTTGSNNTANGVRALFLNTTGQLNTAIGIGALGSNTTGEGNTANGSDALFFNNTGGSNTASGASALGNNTGGNFNTANGVNALLNNTTGSFNTADGFAALFNSTSGSGNIALGVNAGANVTTAGNVIVIGTAGSNVSNSCSIGNIRGVTTANANAIPVLIDSAGQLGTMSSSKRFKKEIKPMNDASESILALKPVTFHYKTDNTNTQQFGLIAEDVATVNPDLVVRDENGEIYTVRYDAVNAMLLNEFLKEHKKVQDLKSTAATQEATIGSLKSTVARQEARSAQQEKDFRLAIAQQQKKMEVLTTQLKEQSAQIRKVRAQAEINRPSTKVVASNP
jgi:hypothetical protein